MIYRHYKGKYYVVLGEALACGVDEEYTVIIYSPLYPCDHNLFTRPKVEFHETMPDLKNGKLRFTYIGRLKEAAAGAIKLPKEAREQIALLMENKIS